MHVLGTLAPRFLHWEMRGTGGSLKPPPCAGALLPPAAPLAHFWRLGNLRLGRTQGLQPVRNDVGDPEGLSIPGNDATVRRRPRESLCSPSAQPWSRPLARPLGGGPSPPPSPRLSRSPPAMTHAPAACPAYSPSKPSCPAPILSPPGSLHMGRRGTSRCRPASVLLRRRDRLAPDKGVLTTPPGGRVARGRGETEPRAGWPRGCQSWGGGSAGL